MPERLKRGTALLVRPLDGVIARAPGEKTQPSLPRSKARDGCHAGLQVGYPADQSGCVLSKAVPAPDLRVRLAFLPDTLLAQIALILQPPLSVSAVSSCPPPGIGAVSPSPGLGIPAIAPGADDRVPDQDEVAIASPTVPIAVQFHETAVETARAAWGCIQSIATAQSLGAQAPPLIARWQPGLGVLQQVSYSMRYCRSRPGGTFPRRQATPLCFLR